MIFTHYNSISELRAVTYDKSHNQQLANELLTKNGNIKWYGVEGGAPACLALLDNGHPDGAQKVHDAITALTNLPRAYGVGRVLIRSNFGDELDIHAVNSGNSATAWSSRKRKVTRTVTNIRLCVDIGANYRTDSDSLLWRGVAGLALSNLLSKAKYKTEIVACLATGRTWYGQKEPSIVSITVKPFGAYMDIDLLSSTVCLAGFFRTLGLMAVVKQADLAKKECIGSLGHYINVEHLYPLDNKCMQIMVPSSIDSKQSAMTWLNETIDLIQGAKK